ncbi:MAG: reductive dehalogenase [Chloroflexi bacterium]|nr:reductive dehalogenase [Chloroflexota bacterium]
MNKFHSTISRRTFMKAIGLGAAGATAVGAASFTFGSFDDILSAGDSVDKSCNRPWWVKERPLGDPSVKVDYSLMNLSKNDNSKTISSADVFSAAMGEQAYNAMTSKANANSSRDMKANLAGFQARDYAANAGLTNSNLVWALAQNVSRPADLVPYSGTPEENSKMIRAIARFYGATGVYFTKFTAEEMNMANNIAANGTPFVVDQTATWAYEQNGGSASGKYVVPYAKPIYGISLLFATPKELWRQGATEDGGRGQLGQMSNGKRYRDFPVTYSSLQLFLRYLGYNGFGYYQPTRTWLPGLCDAIMTGAAESCRQSNVVISPELGPTNGCFSIFTDMPLAPNAPIDAGIFRFCKTCAKCATTCPTGAITTDKEPTWDHFNPSDFKYNHNKIAVSWHTPGKENFFWDATACRYGWDGLPGCSNCIGTCTFNSNSGAGIHEFVKPMVSTTSLLNGFFAKADDFYGFNLDFGADRSKWWDKSWPTNGVDSTVLARDGAYRQRGQ